MVAIVVAFETTETTNVKSALITGCSSGYGLETAPRFHAQGWNVFATMRMPRADLHRRSERMRVLQFDVTERGQRALWRVRGHADGHDAEVFEANTFGVMAMTQAVLSTGVG